MSTPGEALVNAFAQGYGLGQNIKKNRQQNAIRDILAQNYTAPVAPMSKPQGIPDYLVPNYDPVGKPGGFNMQGAIGQMMQQGMGPEALQMQQGQDASELKKLYTQAQIAHLNNPMIAGPSSVQEWKYFNALSPEDQARFLEMKRAPTVLQLGGTVGVRKPGAGGIGESYTVTPKPDQMPAFKAAQTTATELAKGQAGIDVANSKKGVQAGVMSDLVNRADKLLSDASSGYIGTGLAYGKRALGISDKETQANQQLKLISGWMVSNVPRMEGPQSDYDVKNYKDMAAVVGDSTVPIEDRRAALKQLLAIQSRYLPNGQPKASQSVSQAPSQKDLEYTAMKYGMTIDQVKQKLGMQ